MAQVGAETALDVAIGRATDFLLRQAETEFSEARHEMTFPYAAGFTGRTERQSSDVFARATLGGVIADIVDLSGDSGDRLCDLRRLARGEADYIARRKLAHCEGGWSYFPDLPELPPDADSLAAALSLFARVAPKHVDLCRRPIDILLAGARHDGSFETWIIGPGDSPTPRERMDWGLRYCWGTGSDHDVIAHFYHALLVADPIRYAEAVGRGAAMLKRAQQTDGLWIATWYVGPAYATGLSLQVLQAVEPDSETAAAAHAALCRTQHDDGTWPRGRPIAMETALSMWALLSARDAESHRAFDLAAGALVRMQEPDGSWELSPWIRMPIGRATGHVGRVATYSSVTITSAFCLRSLVAARARAAGSKGGYSWPY